MKLKALAAVAVAGIMVMSVPMVAMAETDIEYPNGCTEPIDDSKDTLPTGSPDGVIKVKGDVTGFAIEVQNKNAQVEGNVRANSNAGEGAVYSSGSSNWVHVSGEVKSSGTGRAIVAYYGTEVTVGSAENTSAEATVRASGSGTTVTIKADEATGATGAVTNNGNGTAIQADNGATVTADSAINSEAGQNGPATIRANVNSTGDKDNKTKITVDGAVTNKGNGMAIEAYRGATVTAGSATNGITNSDSYATVHADASTVTIDDAVTNNGAGRAINVSGGSNVTAGSVTSGIINYDQNNQTIYADASTVKITGDVIHIGSNNAIAANNSATVVVEGTVKSNTGDGSTVYVDANSKIVAYKIENGGSGGLIHDNAENVSYIIKKASTVGDFTLAAGTGAVGSVTSASGTTTYQTATAATDYTITIIPVDGYTFKSISSIDNAEAVLTPNGDGTYNLIVPTGGGVSLELVYEAIKKQEEQKQSSGVSSTAVFTSIPTSQGSSSAPITSGTWAQASNGKFTYTNNGQKLINCVAWIQYTDAQGQVVTGKYCFDNNGYALVNTWKEVQSGVWNYFGADGKMVTNATTPDGYVVDANGEWRK